MQRILLVNAYSPRNLGDALIVSASSKFMAEAWQASVAVSSRYDDELQANPELRSVPALIPFPRRGSGNALTRAGQMALGTMAAFALAGLSRVWRAPAKGLGNLIGLPSLGLLFDADAMALAGGGYYYSSKRRIDLTLVHNVLTCLLGAAAGKRVVMMPQSIGPFTRARDRWLVKQALKRVAMLHPRDEYSVVELERMGFGDDRIVPAPDIAFWHWRPDVVDEVPSSRRVGVLVMDWSWSDRAEPGSMDEYLRSLRDFVCSLSEKGYEVVLTGTSSMAEQGQDDIQVAESLAEAVAGRGSPRPAVVRTSTPEELSELCSDLAVLVSTRLHGCIISLLSGTPAVGLAYQPKTEGTFAQLGLDDLCLDVRRLDSADLEARVLDVLSKPVEYRARVHEALTEAKREIARSYSLGDSELEPFAYRPLPGLRRAA